MDNKELVIYKNTLNKFQFDGSLTEHEQIILFNLFREAKEKQNTLIKLSYKDFKYFIDKLIRRLSFTEFEKILLKLTKLNAQSIHKTAKVSYGVGFAFFDHIYFSKDKDFLEVQLTNASMFFFNNISKEYTKLNLIKFSKIQSTYIRIIYRNLLSFLSTGEWVVNYNDFKEILDIPKSYRANHIDQRILNKAKKDLAPYFNNLKIKKIKDTKSNVIKTLVFSFDKEPINQEQKRMYKAFQKLSELEKASYDDDWENMNEIFEEEEEIKPTRNPNKLFE